MESTSIFDMNVSGLPPQKPNLSDVEKKIERKRNLQDLAKIFELNGIQWFCWWGTLLGAIRGGDFILHDTDDDIGVYHEERQKFTPAVLESLQKEGFVLFRAYGGMTFSIKRRGLYIDVQLFEKRADRAFLYGSMGFPAECFWPSPLDQATLDGWTVPVPRSSEILLSGMYGKSWRIPRKGMNNHYPNLFFQKTLLNDEPSFSVECRCGKNSCSASK